MVYTSNPKITELEPLTTPDNADIIPLGDASDNGRAKGITWTNFKTAIEGLTSYFNKTTAVLDDISNVSVTGATAGQLLAFDGTNWVPNTSSTPDATTAISGKTRLSVAPVAPAIPIAVGDNDTRIPSQAENDALVGTSGTASSTNKYVTNDDTSATGVANKVYRLNGSGAIDGTLINALDYTKVTNLNGYLGSQVLSVGANTITAGFQATWNSVVLEVNAAGTFGYAGDINLFKTGKVSGSVITAVGAAPSFYDGTSASVSGTTITIARLGNQNMTPSVTAYYYR